jgi:hypothetical protein
MSKFNFRQVQSKLKRIERDFIANGIELARREMLDNIRNQSSKESGQPYPELTYLLDWKPKNPPRLVLTRALLDEIIFNRPVILGNKGILTIDPIDERGKGYASYHQDGENQFKSKEDFQAEFVTQSSELDAKQKTLLIGLVQSAFN